MLENQNINIADDYNNTTHDEHLMELFQSAS